MTRSVNSDEALRGFDLEMAYIPEERAPRLVEIQFTVLPEAEWLLGIADLSYFQGIGFSLPIPFDVNYFTGDDDSEESLVHAMASSTDSLNMYALLPGLFYCSIQKTTVDAVLVEVTEKNILGMALSTFRPEGVRSFDTRSGLAVDEDGKIRQVEISMETTGKFAAGLSAEIASSLEPAMDTTGSLSLTEVMYSREIEIAGVLAQMLVLENLKRAYVSSSILTGQVMTLLHDIQTNGLKTRNRIYVKNHKYPEGEVVNVRYRTIDGDADSGIRSGIDCPEEVDLGLEIMRLPFAKLLGDGKEVDIEEAVLDTNALFRTELGSYPDKDQIMELIFSEGFE
ncbi:MAG: hypothetical protein ACW99U_06665 [Candidatus Thorarchaeota archaeon]